MSRFGRCLTALHVALLLAAACGPAPGTRGAGSGGQPGTSLELGGFGNDCRAPAGDAGDGSAGDCSATSSVDYAEDVSPILGRCSGEACHHFDAPTLHGWIGAPADECCNQRQLVTPGHPERSYFIDKLEGNRLCYGERMPLGRAPLTASEIAVLKNWICSGAPLP